MRFRLAESSDAPRIIDLLERARQHKIDNGEVAPWSVVRHSRIEQGIAEKLVYLALDDTEDSLVGTLQMQQTDEEVWGDDATPALYIHRLAVDPALQSRGAGGEIIDWASDQAASLDAHYLRLDAHVGCTQLRGWYEKRGFKSVGEAFPPSYRRPSMRYQKQLRS